MKNIIFNSVLTAGSLLFLFISFSCSPSIRIMKETPDPGLNNKCTISGYITDGDTKEPMIGATIILNNDKYNGEYKAVSNVNGFFIFKNIPPDYYQVRAKYIGYKPAFKPNFRVKGNYRYELNIEIFNDFATLELH